MRTWIWILTLLVLVTLLELERSELSMLSRDPQVLRVCQDCPYHSIQEAVDAASPGDVIEVYPVVFYHTMVVYYPTAVTISKPLTLEAKAIPPWEVVLIPQKFPDQPGTGLSVAPIFRIKAKSGRVVIRGFVFQDEDLVWDGGAELVLERNRFRRTTPWSIISIGLSGPGRAQLIENEMNDIDGLAIENGAQVLLKSNRIRPRPDLPPEFGVIYISGPLLPEEEIDKRNRVIFEQNIIEGSVYIGCGNNEVFLEDNVLIGRSLRGEQPDFGLMIGGGCGQGRPQAVVQANRNLIARYQIGVAINDCKGVAAEELQLGGQDNVIEQNGQALCPPDYPWPPGFRKP